LKSNIKLTVFQFYLFSFTVFDVIDTVRDNSHKYINDKDNLHSSLPKVIAKDIQILQKSLPAGIWVKTFENRVVINNILQLCVLFIK